MAKEKEVKFYVINLPIKNNDKENKELYSEFFKFLYEKDETAIAGEKLGMIRRCSPHDDSEGSLFGYISIFTDINKNWIDVSKRDRQQMDMAQFKNKYPNLKESMYFFYPKLHRLVIIKSQDSPSINIITKFFEKLRQTTKKYEFDVFLEKSKDAWDQVLNAQYVSTLNCTITYTNADTGSAAFKFLEKEIKTANMGQLNVEAKAKKGTEGIQVKKSTILKGAGELSKSYGNFEASIVNGGKLEKISDKDYPLILKILTNMSDMTETIAKLGKRLRIYLKAG